MIQQTANFQSPDEDKTRSAFMTGSAIRVEKLGKRYRIGKAIASAKRSKKVLNAFAAPFQYLLSSLREPSSQEIIWALKDVSFEVQKGEVVGIIGRNGAGKSTLLKILSRITEPTEGNAFISGRIGSLLEVGTGFHPELTGRENIYLNGSILGMKKAEIDLKFDEIVAFAEVGTFIETPVKRYSSGMYVRLAFSVAAHLEPEILLIDEVLAVGDLTFQQKCLNRVKSLTTNGMTVLLVSHNMAAIQSACNRAVFLERGMIAAQGDTLQTIQAYQASLRPNGASQEKRRLPEDTNEQSSESGISILNFDMMGRDGICRREFRFGEPVRICINLYAHQRIEHPMINFGIRRGDGVVVCNFNNWYDNFNIDYIEGECSLEGWLPPLRLIPDFYEIHVLVWHWGGGHVVGDLSRSRPLAWSTFGEFRMTGLGLNSHDGVVQMPAQKWRFHRQDCTIEHTDISSDSIYKAFN
jgi:lipopolysaccharide transport system ATP-binding protein